MTHTKSSQPGKTSLLMEFFRIPNYYENNFWRIIANLVWGGGLLLAFAGLLIIGTVLQEHFLTLATLKIITADLLTVGLMASVIVVIFSNGGLDLAIGAVGSLVAIVAAISVQQGVNPAQALLLGLSVALLIGLVNGMLVGFARIPGILVTFAMMSLARGVGSSIAGDSPLPLTISDPLVVSALKVSGWVLLALVSFVAALLVQFPTLGHKIGLKPPEEAPSALARACFWGIPYVCSSLLAGFVGLIQASQSGTGTPALDASFEIQVILAVVLGGSVIGCRFGNVIGALFGTLFIATFHHILVLAGVSAFRRQLSTGALFLLATGLCYGYNGIVGILYRRQAQPKAAQAA